MSPWLPNGRIASSFVSSEWGMENIYIYSTQLSMLSINFVCYTFLTRVITAPVNPIIPSLAGVMDRLSSMVALFLVPE